MGKPCAATGHSAQCGGALSCALESWTALLRLTVHCLTIKLAAGGLEGAGSSYAALGEPRVATGLVPS